MLAHSPIDIITCHKHKPFLILGLLMSWIHQGTWTFKNSLSKEWELVWKLLYLWNLSIQFMNSGSVALSWDASGCWGPEEEWWVTVNLDGAHWSGNNWCWSLRKRDFRQITLQGKQWEHAVFFQKQNKESFINKTQGNLLSFRKLGWLLQERSLLCLTVQPRRKEMPHRSDRATWCVTVEETYVGKKMILYSC